MNQKPTQQNQTDDIEHLTSSTEYGTHGLDDIMHDGKGEPEPVTGEFWVVVFYTMIGVALLAVLPMATDMDKIPASQWYNTPWLAPAFGLGIMVLSLILKVMPYLKGDRKHKLFDSFIFEFNEFVPVIKIALMFIGYIIGVLYLGYLIATLLFAIACLYHTQLRGWKYISIAVVLTAVMILLFRVILKIWLPTPDWYTTLPDPLVSFFSTYF